MSPLSPDEIIAEPTYRTHASIVVRAPASTIWRGLLDLPMSALPAASLLTKLRHAPAVISRREAVLDGAQTFLGTTPMRTLQLDEPRLVVSGGLSRPWKLFGSEEPPWLSAEELLAWNKPGWVKVVESFLIAPLPDESGSTLSTEMRIAPVDEKSRRAFAPYWFAIKHASALIRHEVLDEVRRRAEQDQTPRCHGGLA